MLLRLVVHELLGLELGVALVRRLRCILLRRGIIRWMVLLLLLLLEVVLLRWRLARIRRLPGRQ